MWALGSEHILPEPLDKSERLLSARRAGGSQRFKADTPLLSECAYQPSGGTVKVDFLIPDPGGGTALESTAGAKRVLAWRV